MPGFPKEEDHSGLGWGMDLDRDSNPWADSVERGPPPGVYAIKLSFLCHKISYSKEGILKGRAQFS
jgi:hypothetical protein